MDILEMNIEVKIMSGSSFDISKIKELSKQIAESNIIPYTDLPEYDLFLSQVIDYLNDRFPGEKFTNNIVQNYIKNDVISKPEDGKKRGYTKVHLTELVLLSYMRPVLTTEEIKKVFSLAFNEINDRSDDIISWENAYKTFTEIQKESFDDFIQKEFLDSNKLDGLMEGYNLNGEEQEKITVFLIVMTLIAQASAIKKLAQNIVEQYSNYIEDESDK